MNKEITCRMIDGKPVVEYKEEYVPVKGDIVKIAADNGIILAVHNRYNNYQAIACFGNVGDTENILFCLNANSDGMLDSHAKATPEESEVMLHILSENGYELKGDMVVKKRWIPKFGEKYWYIDSERNRLSTRYSIRGGSPAGEYYYQDCFKNERSAQFACDKLNELRLTLPQE